MVSLRHVTLRQEVRLWGADEGGGGVMGGLM